MGSKNIPSYTIVAIMRILEEYTDDGHALSINEIRSRLQEVYGIDVSDDTVRKQVKGLVAFQQLRCPRDGKGRKMADYDTGTLFPETEIAYVAQGKAQAGEQTGARVTRRAFDDAEVDFIASAVHATSDTGAGEGGDLMRRIRSLQSPAARLRARDGASLPAHGPKPSLTEFASNLITLQEAIEEQCTVSFAHVRYCVQATMQGHEVVAKPAADADGGHVHGASPLRLQCVNGDCYLLANYKGDLRAFRIDLMRDLCICDDTCPFERPADEQAVEEYFTGAIEGCAGPLSAIVLRCNAQMLHSVAGAFASYPEFSVKRNAHCRHGWFEVSFLGSAEGIERWAQHSPDGIELVAPTASRQRVMQRLANNAYGLALNSPRGEVTRGAFKPSAPSRPLAGSAA